MRYEMRVAYGREQSTIQADMVREIENCLHLQGLKATVGLEYRCPVCEARLDVDGVARWVRAAERARDEAYSMIQGDEFGKIVREESQREVYRRRKVMYELQNIPQAVAARPEMILVVHNADEGSYGCKIFYKEPRPVAGLEEIEIEAGWNAILELRSHPDPVVRVAAEKVEEFHGLRQMASREETPPPARRVFYANEL